MKRSEALRSLSRDHHRALVVAQQLRRATAVEEGLATFTEFWQADGHHHFRIEEEVLLPVWALHGEVDREGMVRMLSDHLWIRSEALRLQRSDVSLDSLRELGERLAAHVRFEERELFPAIEADLDERSLAELAATVTKAEAEAHRAPQGCSSRPLR